MKVDCNKLKTESCRATTKKKKKEKGIANKPLEERKLNHKKYSIDKQAGKVKKREKEQIQQIENK